MLLRGQTSLSIDNPFYYQSMSACPDGYIAVINSYSESGDPYYECIRVATPVSKVTTGIVERSGPTNEGALIPATQPKSAPNPQTWTDIAVPVTDAWAGGSPYFYESGPPSQLSPGQTPKTAPEKSTFPWWLVAIGAALVFGS